MKIENTFSRYVAVIAGQNPVSDSQGESLHAGVCQLVNLGAALRESDDK